MSETEPYQLTVSEFVARSHPTEEAVGFTDSFLVEIESDEQIYSRVQPIDGDAFIDFGWVEDPGLILVKNMSKETLRVSLFLKLPPGCSMRAWGDSEPIPIRSKDPCKIKVVVFPR